MAKKSLFFYVVVSFLIISGFIYFYPHWATSPLMIVLFATVFNFVIGTYWKESFKLAVINYVWILLLSFFVITTSIVMIAEGQSGTPPKLLWPMFLMVIGVPLTIIVINWKGKRHFGYSLFDKILYKTKRLLGGKHNSNKRYRNHHKDKSKKILYIIIFVLLVIIFIQIKPFEGNSFKNLIPSEENLDSSKIDSIEQLRTDPEKISEFCVSFCKQECGFKGTPTIVRFKSNDYFICRCCERTYNFDYDTGEEIKDVLSYLKRK